MNALVAMMITSCVIWLISFGIIGLYFWQFHNKDVKNQEDLTKAKGLK